jgi:competence protein ComEA
MALRREMLFTGGLLAIIGGASFISLKPTEIPVPQQTLERQPIAVSVAGEVNRPGVYKLPWGARVQAALEAAGGATPQAEVSLLNPAQILTDGDQLRVPAKGISGRQDKNAASPSGERINLNTATPSQIETLPGVGPKLAQRIIEGRPYSSLKDLDAVKGVGPSMLKKLEPLIKF